jgi:hypothetical protein
VTSVVGGFVPSGLGTQGQGICPFVNFLVSHNGINYLIRSIAKYPVEWVSEALAGLLSCASGMLDGPTSKDSSAGHLIVIVIV